MIVLEMLRPHPSVHVVNIEVNVLQSGKAEPVMQRQDDDRLVRRVKVKGQKVLFQMTLPMLAFGEPDLPEHLPELERYDHVDNLLPEFGYTLGYTGFITWGEDHHRHQQFKDGEGKLYHDPHTHQVNLGKKEGYESLRRYYFRREGRLPGPHWEYYLFADDISPESNEASHFWLNPPVARLEPWQWSVNWTLYEKGYRKGWFTP